MRVFLVFLGLLAPLSTVQAKPERIGTLGEGWALVQDKEQGRCVVQSPPIWQLHDTVDGVMIINVMKDDPKQLVITFTNPAWNFFLINQKYEGRISLYKEEAEVWPEDYLDVKEWRTPVWSNEYDSRGRPIYYGNRGGSLFVTIIPYEYEAIDPHAKEPVNLLSVLTEEGLRKTVAGWRLEFSDSEDTKEKGRNKFVVALSDIPNLTPLLQCVK